MRRKLAFLKDTLNSLFDLQLNLFDDGVYLEKNCIEGFVPQLDVRIIIQDIGTHITISFIGSGKQFFCENEDEIITCFIIQLKNKSVT